MSKKDNGASIILAYLNEKNRPYSAQDVFCNLQKQHGLGKTAVVKAMELLAQEGKIKEKMYGKQKIYFADQSQFRDVNDADLKAMDKQISELSAEVQTLTQSCRQLDTELKELNSSLTTEEMMAEIQELKAECSGYRERLEKIKSATNHVTPEEKEKVYKERDVYVKEWKKRKRLASDMMNSILEGYPKSKKEFLEEVGVETDEDCQVVLPTT
ncbi:PREDICTED: homologous-pairing protein 2 homolog [Poecilia mexicana]|uniref:Homologous-pairing protein 2 homolog n=2 Tax=Poecilia TaxID=8080 RepID=A0A087Y8L7_POEFO|nr:PREDICTED: homologous-pairing protein 2 homolog [Poecilia formosa]XP_007558237.1 PREDICTED: homologous-pairing protein 2 homolog [Poecilia formosa]XP_014834412.1 PREDICTED: homologous-pairing protein 2 homolog [Poecilia mexicana]